MEIFQCYRLAAALPALVLLLGTIPAAPAATLSAGAYHSCAIGEAAGELRCWGYGANGALGNGNLPEPHHAAPVQVVTPAGRWRAVAVGEAHGCAIAAGGNVYCWGYNAQGQLGDGTLTSRAVPVAVIGLGNDVAQLAVGAFHSCALLRNGKVNCWGLGANGQLGSGQTANQTTPGEVLSLDGAVAIGAGNGHTCAVLGDGSVKCWGLNTSRQIGDGTTAQRLTPVFASVGLNAVELAVGYYHSCVRSAAGAVRCWGYNGDGALGDGSITVRTGSVAVDGLDSGVTHITAGTYHNCALAAGGVLKCWGKNNTGQVGNDAVAAAVTRPVNVMNLTIPVAEVAAGMEHTCVRASANRVHCWGGNAYGRSSFGDTQSVLSVLRPQPVSGLPSPLARLSLRGNTACGATRQGTVSCWGNNSAGQIGDALTLSNADLIQQAGPRDVVDLDNVTDVAAGGLHACALRADRTVWCWGSNAYGQLGDQTALQRRRPVQVVGIVDAVQIAAGPSYTCARTAPGAVWCWGLNDNGQLGIGSTSNSLQAVRAVGLEQNVVDISLGHSHACAARNDGKVLCWGLNGNGQLGDGTTTQRTVPTLVNDAFGNYVAVAAAASHSCGLTVGGQPKCWGYNHVGQLGDGSTLQRTTPAAVAVLTDGVVRIAAGSYHTCALRNTGALFCWGYNADRQIGDGTTMNRLQPVAASNVGGAIRDLAVGGEASCTVLADGEGECWGNNAYGHLGNGSTASPLAVPQRIAQWLRDDLIFRDPFGG